MVVAVVSLALVVVTAVALIAWLAHQLNAARTSEAKAKDRAREEQEIAERYLEERDQAVKDHAATDALKRALQQRVYLLQQEVLNAHERATEQIAQRLKAANVADAARIVDELLQAPLLPGVPKGAATEAGGDNGG